jgi:hypothetical protein
MRRLILLVSLFVLMASPAMAQVEITAGAGYMFPMYETKDLHHGEYNFGGSVGFYLTDLFSVGGEIYYHKLGLTDAQIDYLEEQELEVSKSLTNFTASAKLLFSDNPLSLYGKVLVGSYEYKENIVDDNIMGVASKKYPGFGGGFGLHYQSPGFFGAFVEGVYNHIFLDDGDVMDYMDVRAGFVLKGY